MNLTHTPPDDVEEICQHTTIGFGQRFNIGDKNAIREFFHEVKKVTFEAHVKVPHHLSMRIKHCISNGKNIVFCFWDLQHVLRGHQIGLKVACVFLISFAHFQWGMWIEFPVCYR